MAFSLHGMYEQKEREFRAGGSPDTFQPDFLTAVNDCIGYVNVQCNLETELAFATDESDTIDLDQEHQWVLSDGVSWRLLSMGYTRAGMKPGDLAAATAVMQQQFERGVPQIKTRLHHTNQADTDNDVIGLGAVD